MEDGSEKTKVRNVVKWVNVTRENDEKFIFARFVSLIWCWNETPRGWSLPGPSIMAWISVRFDSLTWILIPSSCSVVRFFTSLDIIRITCGLWFSRFDILKGKNSHKMFENKRKWGRWKVGKVLTFVFKTKKSFSRFFVSSFANLDKSPLSKDTYWTHDGILSFYTAWT